MAKGICGLGASRIAFGRWIVYGIGLGAFTTSALAADFHVTPALQLGETWTDNVNIDTSAQAKSDFITTISPNLDMTSQGARVKLGMNYAPQELIFLQGTSSNTLQQRLQGDGHVEVWPETLFFDAHASIDQQFVNAAGPVANTTLTTNSNLQTVQAYSGSPSLLHHFGSFADTKTSYTFAQVTTGGGTIAPSRINEVTQTVTSGDDFERLGWSLIADGTEDERLASNADPLAGTKTKDYWAEADLSYRIYRGLKIIGGAGYERFSDPTLTNQPNGIIYNGGFQIDPSPRTSAKLVYQRRFGLSGLGFDGHYDIGPKLRVLASYNQTIQTGQSQIATNLNQLGLSQTGVLVNTQTGLPFTAGNGFGGVAGSGLGISSAAFVDKVFQTTLQATSGRNTYIGTAFYERQTFENPSASDSTFGGTVAWTRQLWPLLASNVSSSVGNTDFGGTGTMNRTDTFYIVTAGLSYTVSPTVTAQFNASRSSRSSTISADRQDVDIVGVSVRKQF